ncbi:TPA: oligosaccharide flippase family protein [Clostridium perfringens]
MIKNNYLNTIISKIVLILIQLLTTMILSRYLGPELKGKMAYILNISGIITIILDAGLEQTYGYFKRKNVENNFKKYLKVILIINIVYLFIGVLLNIILNNVNFIFITIISLFNIISIQLSYVMMIENINLRNKINIIVNIVYFFIILNIYFFTKSNLYFVLIIQIFRFFIEIILYNFKFKITIKDILKEKIEREYIVDMIKIGIPAMIMSLLITFNYSLDQIILKNYVNYYQLGLYSAGAAIASLAWFFTDSFKDVITSKTTEKDSVSEIIFSIKFNIYISIFIIIFFVLFGKFAIYIVHGSKFLNSYYVTIIILFGNIPMIFYKIINSLYINKGKQKISVIILSVSVIENIILNNILIPIWGINGAAFSTVFSYTSCGLIFLIIFCNEYNIKLKKIIVFEKKEIKALIHKVRR